MALFSVGYLPAYLLPVVVARVVTDLGVTATQAGAVGSGLLLASAGAGLLLATRVRTIGARRLARAGLTLLILGFALAAVAPSLPPLILGCLLGGLGTGTVAAVAGVGIAAADQPHRLSAHGLLAASATAAGLFLALPHLPGGHALPFAALATYGAATLPTLGRLPGTPPHPSPSRGTRDPDQPADLRPSLPCPSLPCPSLPCPSHLPRRAAGTALALGMAAWSMAQNALWGVSSQIGLHRVGLSESTLGLVFAAALGGGLLGVLAAAALGTRLGRAVPIGAGTAVIALCVATAGSAQMPVPFATGEVLWNSVYPLVLTHLLGLAAALDRAGRWAVLVGAASSLGVACGPVAGAALAGTAGFPATGLALDGLLAAVAVPLTAVARRSAEPSAEPEHRLSAPHPFIPRQTGQANPPEPVPEPAPEPTSVAAAGLPVRALGRLHTHRSAVTP
ncbi:MFS transporter [Kitasatospora sp. MMS16-BH015]|uniref:MFS transporter n=1 Tax=Kitasatospora sp. MMS16-BH015 TaxID=2018025 RepID=UPI00131A4DED|nr:MFS transporter [Kitasatospora sp. MMS16-BH015]